MKQQRIVWKYMKKVREATPMEMTKATGIPRPTVSQALAKLLKLKRVGASA